MLNELRYALRALSRAPGFTLVAAGGLAIGVDPDLPAPDLEHRGALPHGSGSSVRGPGSD